MSGDVAEPWRKTGRKAAPEHLLGITKDVLLEVGLYHDDGTKQGQAIVQVLDVGEEITDGKGRIHTGHFHAIEDEYYAWWLKKEFAGRPVPLHFCMAPASRCGEATVYRNPIHIDVFRVMPGRSALKVNWLKEEDKRMLEDVVNALMASSSSHATPGPPGVGSRGEGDPAEAGVQSGVAGISGLARALGQKEEKGTGEEGKPTEPVKKKQKLDKEEKDSNKELEEILTKRKMDDGGCNVLRLGRDASSGKKKKKKKKAKKEKDSTGSESDSSSTSSLFRLAALPKGVERLHRLHEERPGAIANSTLRRFNVLLNQSVGRGAAEVTEDLPPVARGYMSQIFLAKHPEGTIGMRNLREMRTLTTVLDLLASNQVLQAMDIISQRIKSVELFVSQGHWAQGSLLELVAAEGEQRAYSREEVKVAQVEYKAELQMQKAQWQRPTQWWIKDYRTPVNPPGDKGEDGEKGDRAPTNTGGQEKGKKGKGKGKKGKRKW